ncbi:coiled-coil domain-containing protein 175 [Myotis daubentonii]|uniref:coiled-coil domain-containing protein 175 n=1 Tax=Myotis daubentonii TaxID=98922 RepID=UPI0028736D49|nr:coiled-coil domain-containing protein 175 [Myotis daubentonii]
MALHSWSPELGFSEKLKQVAVSTGPSLDLSTFPSTLGSVVATAALEQLFIVEQSLQSDYFKCNEEATIFLKDIAIAVRRLEEMRRATIEHLEIESMELSRLYFLLETLPDHINTELEEFVVAARKLNLLEIKQLRMEVARLNKEIEFLKRKMVDLKDTNNDLGEQQKELAKKHEKLVVLLNHAMGKKAIAAIYINETYTKINLEKEEIRLKKKSIQGKEAIIVKDKGEYLKAKKRLSGQMNEYENICESKKQDAYYRKKQLDKLRIKEMDIKEKVITSTVELSDHNLEIAELNQSIRHWQEQIEEIKKICNSLEEKIFFLKKNKKKLGEKAITDKNEFFQKIKEMNEKIYKAQLENKDLQEKLQTLTRQYKIVLQEEDKVRMQKKKIQEENNKQLKFISEKENFLSQRKVDIKNMEEGLVTLSELYRATQEVYRKHIEILSENLEREIQRCVLTRWKIACLTKRHGRWLLKMREELEAIMDQIKAAEDRRSELIEETSVTEKEITESLVQIKKVTLDLKQTETEFVINEKKLIQELNKYEVNFILHLRIIIEGCVPGKGGWAAKTFTVGHMGPMGCEFDMLVVEQKFVKKMESTKEKEDELFTYLPTLQETEEEYTSKNKMFQELGRILTEQKKEQNLLNDQISQMTREFTRQMNLLSKLRRELQQLRDHESDRIKSHFEILKNLENEIYAHDLETEALLLENERLKKYIAYMKTKIEPYAQEAKTYIYSDLSWHLVANYGSNLCILKIFILAQYLDLWAEFQITLKEFVGDCEDTLQEIKSLIDRLCARDEKIEKISIWLRGNLEELRFLATVEIPEKMTKQTRTKKVHFPVAARIVKKIVTKKK